MKAKNVTLVAALMLSLGCLHGGQRDRAFTPDWAHQCAKEAELEARKAYIRGRGNMVLVDREGALKTTLVTDEEGRPRLRIGKEDGLGGHVRFRGGSPDVRVRYKIGWYGSRPKREE